MGQVEKSPRGFIVRRIIAGAGPVDVSGYGLEILDGGIGEQQNVLLVHRGEGQSTVTFAGDASIMCSPGNRLAADFDRLELVDRNPLGVAKDAVIVKVITERRSVWADVPAAFCPLTRYVSRSVGQVNIAAGGVALIYDDAAANMVPEADRYWTSWEADGRRYWNGAVLSDLAFHLYVFCKTDVNNGGSNYRLVQRFISRQTAGAVSAPLGGITGGIFSESVTFEGGQLNTNSVNSAPRAAVPPGSLRVAIENTSGALAGYEWMFGFSSAI